MELNGEKVVGTRQPLAMAPTLFISLPFKVAQGKELESKEKSEETKVPKVRRHLVVAASQPVSQLSNGGDQMRERPNQTRKRLKAREARRQRKATLLPHLLIGRPLIEAAKEGCIANLGNHQQQQQKGISSNFSTGSHFHQNDSFPFKIECIQWRTVTSFR